MCNLDFLKNRNSGFQVSLRGESRRDRESRGKKERIDFQSLPAFLYFKVFSMLKFNFGGCLIPLQ